MLLVQSSCLAVLILGAASCTLCAHDAYRPDAATDCVVVDIHLPKPLFPAIAVESFNIDLNFWSQLAWKRGHAARDMLRSGMDHSAVSQALSSESLEVRFLNTRTMIIALRGWNRGLDNECIWVVRI